MLLWRCYLLSTERGIPYNVREVLVCMLYFVGCMIVRVWDCVLFFLQMKEKSSIVFCRLYTVLRQDTAYKIQCICPTVWDVFFLIVPEGSLIYRYDIFRCCLRNDALPCIEPALRCGACTSVRLRFYVCAADFLRMGLFGG